ncbi:hypothetical protein [Pseudonocardia sp. ICBG601]|nr:hypothetical protein [Pseudonocardia sp. ICBG601]
MRPHCTGGEEEVGVRVDGQDGGNRYGSADGKARRGGCSRRCGRTS